MKSLSIKTALMFLGLTTLAIAQAPPTPEAPRKEHAILKQLEGEWVSESEGPAGPGQPVMKCKGHVKTRMLGGIWAVSDWTMDMQGSAMHAVQTIGYDPAAKAYVGTWVDSMMNHMWKYQGSVDATGKILTLEADGPNFMADGKLTKFRDTYEFKSADHIVATSSMLGEDGKWVTFMTGEIHRKK